MKEHEALDAILVEEGKYVTHGGGGGGGGGGGLKLFRQSEEHSNVCFFCLVLHGDCGDCVGKVESWVELSSGVARGIGKSLEFAKEGLICDSCGEKRSNVSLALPAEALESLTFDESDSPKEWKDSSSEE